MVYRGTTNCSMPNNVFMYEFWLQDASQYAIDAGQHDHLMTTWIRVGKHLTLLSLCFVFMSLVISHTGCLSDVAREILVL